MAAIAGTQKMRARFALGLPRFQAEDVLGLAVVFILVVLILAPLGAVLIQAFVPGIFTTGLQTLGLGALLEIFQRPLWRQSLINSLMLSTFAAAVGGVIGTMLALMRHSLRFSLAGTLDTCVWLVIILPSFIIAQGWMLFASRAGLANQWFGLGWVPDLVFNPVGLATIMSLKAFPLAYLAVSAGLQWRMDDLGHAAALCGASPRRVLLTIRLPLLLPAVLSGMVLIFIEVLGDFGLPAALATSYRFPTLTYAIYVAINQSPIRFDLAGVLAFYVTVLLLLAVTLYFRVLRRSRFDFLTAKAKTSEPGDSPLSWLATVFTAFILILAVIIPIGSSFLVSVVHTVSGGLSPGSFTVEHYRSVLVDGGRLGEALSNSLTIAALAAVGSTIIAFGAAYVVTFSDFRLNRLIDLTCTLSLAVPGVVLGIGYIFIWNSPALDRIGLRLYGYPSILVLAAIAGSVPIAVRILLGALAQVPANMLSAAAMQGAGLGRRILTIAVPMVATAVTSAALTAFGSSVFDLAINSILRPPRLSVLPVYVNRAFELGEFGTSTAATLIAGVATAAIIWTVNFASRRALGRLLSSQPLA